MDRQFCQLSGTEFLKQGLTKTVRIDMLISLSFKEFMTHGISKTLSERTIESILLLRLAL